MFDTVLVANRGEIAVRVIRTLRRLGIRSRRRLQRRRRAAPGTSREADVAVRLGPAAARPRATCDIERDRSTPPRAHRRAGGPPRLRVPRPRTPAFARACADAGLVFVGPPAEAIEADGRQDRAPSATVAAAGVPVVPGSQRRGLTDDDLVEAARRDRLPGADQAVGGRRRQGHAPGRRPGRPAAPRSPPPGARRAAAFGDDTLLARAVRRPARGTSRCRCSPTPTATSCTSASASAACSAGTRRSSRRRRPPLLDAADARAAMGAAAVRAAAAVRLRRRRHGRVHRRRGDRPGRTSSSWR